MNLYISELYRCIQADFFKLKRTPILWISLLGGAAIGLLLFVIHYANAHELENDLEAWVTYLRRGFSMVAYVLVVPFIVLVTASSAYIEHNSLAWKHIYSLPLQKGNVYFSRLILIIFLTSIPFILFGVTLLVGGFLLEAMNPSLDFGDKGVETIKFLKLLFHCFISILGVTAFQYWLSIRFKHFIIPIGIGMIGFLCSLFTLGEVGKLPYLFHAYPMYIVHEIDRLDGLSLNNVVNGLTNWEWYSIGFLILFSVGGYFLERNRNIE